MERRSTVGLTILAVLLLQLDVVFLYPTRAEMQAYANKMERLVELEEKFEELENAELEGPAESEWPAMKEPREQAGIREPAFARMMKTPDIPEPYHKPVDEGRKQTYTGIREPAFATMMKKPATSEIEKEIPGPRAQTDERGEQLLARLMKEPEIARMMMTYARMKETALMQETCETVPICASPSTYDSEECRCVTKNDIKETTCQQSFKIRGFLENQCVCATVTQMQCETGYSFSQSTNCQCISTIDGEKRDPTCPSGSFRPEGACYCVVLQDPSCPENEYVTSTDKCTCSSTEYSTPTCSNSDVCSFDEQACLCKQA